MLEQFSPFNITLLILFGKDSIKNLRSASKPGVDGSARISVMDIMTGMTKNFHPDGLYSTEIFGKVGDVRRSRNFAYIDLYISIFHPVYFKAICDLKELYGGIMSGKEYATFDYQLKDFVKSDPINGFTGYKFFLDHFKALKFAERDSAARSFNIKLVEKFRAQPLMDKIPVMPAGLRDYTVDENGKPTEDEINNLYRRVISIANVIENVSHASNEEYLNNMRYNLQTAVNAIYNYITNILEGKGKLIQGKWNARNIDNSTRNVFTPYIQSVKAVDDPQFVSAEQHVVGLYQFLRAIFPQAVNLVRTGYLSQVFVGPNAPANLVDTKTLKSVSVSVDHSFYDDWMTMDGLEKQFHRFKVKDLRHEPIMIGPYYLGLMYNRHGRSGTMGMYKFVQNIDDVPEALKKDADIHPITYAELFYLSVYRVAKQIPGSITRYPITGYGSIYPSYNYLKSTIKGLVMDELDDEWNRTDNIAPEYPKMGDNFFDALSPASQHIGRLGADYDGDTGSLICYITQEAKAELKKKLNSRDYYVAVNGSMAFSSSNDVLNLVLGNLA